MSIIIVQFYQNAEKRMITSRPGQCKASFIEEMVFEWPWRKTEVKEKDILATKQRQGDD